MKRKNFRIPNQKSFIYLVFVSFKAEKREKRNQHRTREILTTTTQIISPNPTISTSYIKIRKNWFPNK